MSQHRDKEPTELFTVVGAPYVAEHHDDNSSHYRLSADRHVRGSWPATLWLVFYALIGGAAMFGQSAGKAIEYATAFLK